MTIGLVGRKCGMTRVFTEDGALPVTVIEVQPNRVTQIKTKATDKYSAVQVTTGVKKQSRVSKPKAGTFAKANTAPGRGLWEFRVENDKMLDGIAVGSELKLDIFSVGQMVDVTGTSKGKGFAGVVKRHNFRTQDNSHGNSVSHRGHGSIGQRQTPGRVFPGKPMAGHMGQERVTVQMQAIVRLDVERHLILIHGAVPGAPGCEVIIRPAVKAKDKGKKEEAK